MADGYEKEYTEEGFWGKVKAYAQAAGYDVIEKALWLYYVMVEPNVPVWAKTVAAGALGYFISPIDAIPDTTPIIGFADDLGVLTMAVATLAVNITPAIKQKAKDKLYEWFPLKGRGDGPPKDEDPEAAKN